MSDLKSCPFCGGKGHLSTREIRFMGQNDFGAKKIYTGVQVICGRCKARGGLSTGEITYGSYQQQRIGLDLLEKSAAELWNRRAT